MLKINFLFSKKMLQKSQKNLQKRKKFQHKFILFKYLMTLLNTVLP